MSGREFSMGGRARGGKGRVRFSTAIWALDMSAPDIWEPGLSGARTFFLHLFFISYVVSFCSSLRSR